MSSENIVSSNKDALINGLNEDLAREYKAIIQYVVFSSTLKGAEYGNIAEELEKFAPKEEHMISMWKNLSDHISKLLSLKLQTLKAFNE